MTEWIESHGGLTGIEKRNETKAKLVYDIIDSSNGFYHCPVERDSRSLMNVVFRVAGRNGQSAATNPDEAAENEFGKQAAAAGLVGTPGHRSVGGMRVSLYNAVEPAAVEALTGFMRDFQRKRG
jgi:phosphoserine aminotransferase